MRASTLLIVFIVLVFLVGTRQTFWVIVGGVLFVAYLLNIGLYSAAKGARKMGKKARDVYAGEMKELDSTTGKYPAKFFDSVGKGVVEKMNEYQAPSGAKTYREASNYRWAVKKPMDKLGESAQKILDSLGKLFSK